MGVSNPVNSFIYGGANLQPCTCAEESSRPALYSWKMKLILSVALLVVAYATVTVAQEEYKCGKQKFMLKIMK